MDAEIWMDEKMSRLPLIWALEVMKLEVNAWRRVADHIVTAML